MQTRGSVVVVVSLWRATIINAVVMYGPSGGIICNSFELTQINRVSVLCTVTEVDDLAEFAASAYRNRCEGVSRIQLRLTVGRDYCCFKGCSIGHRIAAQCHPAFCTHGCITAQGHRAGNV